MRAVFATIIMLIPANALSAQGPGANVPPTAPLEQQLAGDLTAVHDKVLALANAIPADKYSWRPANDVRSVSEVLMHVAGEWYSLCPRAVGAKPPSDWNSPAEKMRSLERITVKNEVVAELDKAWRYCRTSLDQMDVARLVPDSLPAKMGFPRVALLVSGDQHEHLGQLIAYARSVGIAPPWSR